jgi:hypothetical protein
MAGILYSSPQDSFKTKSKLTKQVMKALNTKRQKPVLNESVYPYFPNYACLEQQVLRQHPIAVLLDLTDSGIVPDTTKFCNLLYGHAKKLCGRKAPPIIAITDTFERGIAAMLGGAYDYVTTKYDGISFKDKLTHALDSAISEKHPELRA